MTTADSNTTEPLLKSDVVSITPFLVHSAVSSGSAAAAEAEAEAAKGSPAKGSRAERGHSPAAKRRRVAPDNSPEMSDAEEDAKVCLRECICICVGMLVLPNG